VNMDARIMDLRRKERMHGCPLFKKAGDSKESPAFSLCVIGG